MSRKWFEKKTDFAVTAFIVLALIMLGQCESAKADWSVEYAHDSNSGITEFNSGLDRLCGRYTFETGASFVGCPVVAVGFDEFRGHSWEIGFADKIGQRWEAQLNLNSYDAEVDGGFTIRRMIGDGPFQLALGGSYWVDKSPGSDSNFTYNLGMRYTF